MRARRSGSTARPPARRRWWATPPTVVASDVQNPLLGVLDLLRFEERLAGCDLVVTGEDRMDDQTAQGKLPAVVARRSRPTPVVAVVGRSDLGEPARHAMGLRAVHAVVDHVAPTDGDPAHDPALTARVLEELGRTIPLPVRAGAGHAAG